MANKPYGVLFRLSTPKMTVQARTKFGIIVEASPVLNKLIGQEFVNLTRWLGQQCSTESELEISQIKE